MVLVTYDVDFTHPGGAKRLRKVAKICENYGIRVQQSVFEMMLDTGQFTSVKAKLLAQIDKEKDSLRIYLLGNNWERRVEHYGLQQIIQQGGSIIL